MSGADIAAEVAAALIEAGEAVGTGAYICTIRRATSAATPWDTPSSADPTLYPVTAVESMKDIRDMSGMKELRDRSGALIGITKRTLTINATGVEPLKSDLIAVGVAPGDVTSETVFEEILAVQHVAPAGVALLYELELAL